MEEISEMQSNSSFAFLESVTVDSAIFLKGKWDQTIHVPPNVLSMSACPALSTSQRLCLALKD